MPMPSPEDHDAKNIFSLKFEARADVKQVRAIEAVATIRKEELSDPDVGKNLEVEVGQRPEWKDIPDCRPTFERYGAQQTSLEVRDALWIAIGSLPTGNPK
jgi:hypothetical protein